VAFELHARKPTKAEHPLNGSIQDLGLVDRRLKRPSVPGGTDAAAPGHPRSFLPSRSQNQSRSRIVAADQLLDDHRLSSPSSAVQAINSSC
jgi:hypothetical protein